MSEIEERAKEAKRLAKAATEGRWYLKDTDVLSEQYDEVEEDGWAVGICEWIALEDAAFVTWCHENVSELAEDVLSLLEERDRLEQENNRLYEAMQNCRENNRRKGEELAGLLFRIDRAREALAPGEEQR